VNAMKYDPEFIITNDNRHQAISYLIDRGQHPAALAPMTNIEIANMYHTFGAPPTPSDAQRAGAQAFYDFLCFKYGGPTPDAAPVAPVQGDDGKLTHYRLPLIQKVVTLNHAVLLVGPAGCGKTTIGEQIAEAINLPFYITNTVTDTHELTGFVDGYGKYHETSFRHAFEHGGVWIADEIDAWDANALLTANSALANGFCSFPDQPTPVNRHPDFRIIATANTFGSGADRIYVGRNELDAASLDRFAMITVDYDLDLERALSKGNDLWLTHVWQMRAIVEKQKIRHVVTSRAIKFGVEALAAAIKLDDVNEIYLMKGMSAKDRAKVDAAALEKKDYP